MAETKITPASKSPKNLLRCDEGLNEIGSNFFDAPSFNLTNNTYDNEKINEILRSELEDEEEGENSIFDEAKEIINSLRNNLELLYKRTNSIPTKQFQKKIAFQVVDLMLMLSTTKTYALVDTDPVKKDSRITYGDVEKLLSNVYDNPSTLSHFTNLIEFINTFNVFFSNYNCGIKLFLEKTEADYLYR